MEDWRCRWKLGNYVERNRNHRVTENTEMKKILLICLAAFALRVNAAETNSAAQMWHALTNFSLPNPPMSWMTNPPTQADVDKYDDQRAAESIAFAERARNFYTKFPKDTNALSSRVLEIQALQMGV